MLPVFPREIHPLNRCRAPGRTMSLHVGPQISLHLSHAFHISAACIPVASLLSTDVWSVSSLSCPSSLVYARRMPALIWARHPALCVLCVPLTCLCLWGQLCRRLHVACLSSARAPLPALILPAWSQSPFDSISPACVWFNGPGPKGRVPQRIRSRHAQSPCPTSVLALQDTTSAGPCLQSCYIQTSLDGVAGRRSCVSGNAPPLLSVDSPRACCDAQDCLRTSVPAGDLCPALPVPACGDVVSSKLSPGGPSPNPACQPASTSMFCSCGSCARACPVAAVRAPPSRSDPGCAYPACFL